MVSKQRLVGPAETQARAQAHELEMLKELLSTNDNSNDGQTTSYELTPADVADPSPSTLRTGG